MEYKYHPAFKHLTFFIISYAFMRHQKIMNNEILLANTVMLTLFIIILDNLFISGHVAPFQPLSYEYIDDDEVIDLKKELKREKKKKSRKNTENAEDEKNVDNGTGRTDNCQIVRMENTLDNFNNEYDGCKGCNSGGDDDESPPQYMAYNE